MCTAVHLPIVHAYTSACLRRVQDKEYHLSWLHGVGLFENTGTNICEKYADGNSEDFQMFFLTFCSTKLHSNAFKISNAIMTLKFFSTGHYLRVQF
jgi:hypothetical protein